MRFLAEAGALLMTVFMIAKFGINLLSGFVGAIWLLVEGEALKVVLGVLFILFGKFVIGLVVLPFFVLLGALTSDVEVHGDKGRAKTFVRVFNAFMAVLMGLAIAGVFAFMLNDTVSRPASLIWAYAVATAPWVAMAKDSPQPEGEGVFLLALVDSGLVIAVILDLLGVVSVVLALPFIIIVAFIINEVVNELEESARGSAFPPAGSGYQGP